MTAKLTGTVDHPDANATITVTDARALGRPVPRLVVQATATDLTGLDRCARDTDRHGRRQAGGRRAAIWPSRPMTTGCSTISICGSAPSPSGRRRFHGQSPGRRPLESRCRQSRRSLAAGADQTGGTNARRHDHDRRRWWPERRAVRASAAASKIGTSALDRLDAQLRVTDVYRRPVIDGNVAIDRVSVAGESDLANSADRQGRGERQRHHPHRPGARLRARRARPSGRRRQNPSGAVEAHGATRQAPAGA